MTDDEFWLSRVSGASNPQGYQGFDEQFATALQKLVQQYESETGRKAGFSSYGRTPEQGREIWERSGHGKNFLAARPGNSRHEYDLSAGRYATAADIPRGDFLNYAHQHAGDVGLSFLTGDAFRRDPVHIQLAGPPKYGSSGANSGGDYGAVSSGGGGYSEDPYDVSIRSLMGLPGREASSDDSPFDVSILRALGGGPLVDVNIGGGGGGEVSGGGGGDNLIGGAYADSLDSGGVQQTVSSTLSSRGWQPGEIAAAIGNAAGESTHDPGAVNSSSGAIGLWQWLGDRKQGLINFANELGKVWTDPEVQALYLDAERSGASARYGGSNEAGNFAKAFSGKGGVADLVAGFAQHVERAASGDLANSMSRRVNGALAFLSGDGGEAGAYGSTGTPGAAGASGVRGWSEAAFPAFGAPYTGYGPTSGPATSAPASPPNPPSRPTASQPTPPSRPATAEPEMPYWNEPDYNELQGGSKHAYHFDPDTGRGVYKTSSGKLIAYDAESGMSSPIGERNVDAFVSRPPKAREGGGGRRIEGSSTLGPASRDPVSRALSDAVRPWPKAEKSPIKILATLGIGGSGGPPPSTLRDSNQVVDLLTQIKAGGNLLDYTYAIKNYADLLDTTPDVLNEMVKLKEFDTRIANATTTKPGTPVDREKIFNDLASMAPGTPEYFDALNYAVANTGFTADQVNKVVESRRTSVKPAEFKKWFEDTEANATARNSFVNETIADLKTFPGGPLSVGYKAARAEAIAHLVGVAGLPNAEAVLASLGL